VPADSVATARVLIADDQPDVLEALRLLLKEAGVEADCTASVAGVREHLASSAYDLLLMDLNYARDTTSGREGRLGEHRDGCRSDAARRAHVRAEAVGQRRARADHPA
jgi:CheY-like chemotaxis protein